MRGIMGAMKMANLRHLATLAALTLSSCNLEPTTPGGTLYGNGSNGPGFPQQPYYPAPSQTSVSSPSNVGSNAPAIRADSYIMINPESGAVLAARNADMQHAVASTQKVLTALVVMDDGNLDKPVRITSSDVAVEPSKLGVRPGDVYSRRELIAAFLVKSANDVANALARDNAGSIEAFAAKMNAKARSLGAMNSCFANPHGLNAPGQYSTARDMARIGMAVYHNPFLRSVVHQRYYTFRYASGHTVTLQNTNELLGMMPECDGMKTGYTGPAGRCLISTAHSSGHEVLLVQLGTKTRYIWNDGAALMQWGLAR
ncbi:MAG: D-alanyl-D-alanine carboxypeptidase family protein [Verrucomicrobiaceae bacterium]